MDAVRAAVVAAGLPLILKDRNNAPNFPPPRLRDTPDPEALRPASAPMMWFYQMTTTVWDGARSPDNAYKGAVKRWRRLRARALTDRALAADRAAADRAAVSAKWAAAVTRRAAEDAASPYPNPFPVFISPSVLHPVAPDDRAAAAATLRSNLAYLERHATLRSNLACLETLTGGRVVDAENADLAAAGLSEVVIEPDDYERAAPAPRGAFYVLAWTATPPSRRKKRSRDVFGELMQPRVSRMSARRKKDAAARVARRGVFFFGVRGAPPGPFSGLSPAVLAVPPRSEPTGARPSATRAPSPTR